MVIVDLGVPPGFALLPGTLQRLKQKDIIEKFAVTGRQAILYIRRLPSRTPVTFEIQLRAKYPVKAKTPPASVYPYYEPERKDEAAPVLLEII